MLNLGGTIREISPEQTLERLQPLLWPKFGITRVANITGLDHVNIPTYISIRPNSKTLSTSQGKGLSKPLAKISAIMESIEGWHAENVRAPDLMGSYHQLKNKYNLLPIELLLMAREFMMTYEEVATRPIGWILAKDIIQEEDIYIPYPLVCLDSSNLPLGYEVFVSSSNGLAVGNTLEEAICHGLYEVIERDCNYYYYRYDANLLEKRAVDINSINCPHNRELIGRIRKAGLQIYIWDISTDCGLPAFRVEIDDVGDIRNLGAFAGHGAHLSRTVALSRAITEAVQSRLTFISGSRDDLMTSIYKNHISCHANYSSVMLRDFNECVKPKIPTNFSECIDTVKRMLKTYGISRAIVFNHTKKGIEIPVVHVFIPEIKSEWREHRRAR